jgi:hypothetical protein
MINDYNVKGKKTIIIKYDWDNRYSDEHKLHWKERLLFCRQGLIRSNLTNLKRERKAWEICLGTLMIYFTRNFKKLKSRTRKEILDSIRGLIWQLYADISKYRVEKL